MKELRELIQRWLSERSTRRWLAGASAALVLMSLNVAMAAGGHGGHGEPHVNWWTWDQHAPPVGWFILDFVFFVAGIVYLTRKPVKALFEKRHAEIKRAITEAEAALSRATAHRDEYRDKLARVDQDETQLVDGAKQDGAQERDRIVQLARAYADRLRGDTDAAAALEAQGAESRLRAETIASVLAEAQGLLIERITPDDRKRLLEDAIADLENDRVDTKRRNRASEATVGGAL